MHKKIRRDLFLMALVTALGGIDCGLSFRMPDPLDSVFLWAIAFSCYLGTWMLGEHILKQLTQEIDSNG